MKKHGRELKKERASLVKRGVQLSVDSLYSHIPSTAEEDGEGKKAYAFHRKCCREYGELVVILTKLL